MIHKKHDHIKTNGKYFKCVVADSQDAVFAPLVKRDECISTIFKDMFVVDNTKSSDFEYDQARLMKWDGSSIKKISPINNSLGTEIDENRTLTIKTKKGKLVFKKGQYLNYVNKEISKP